MGRRRRKRKKGSGDGEPSELTDIPPGAREMVERVKEVVDRPEFEIYFALEDCNMEPNDAINRLLSQEPFQEVKSKRKQKKENKEALLELRSGRESGGSTHGDGDNVDHGECSTSVQMSSSDHGVMQSELVQEKDDGMDAIPTSSSPGSGMDAHYSTQRVTPQSDSDFINASRSTGPGEHLSIFSQAPWGFQSRRPMPEAVRMGSQQRTVSSTHIAATNTYQLFKSCDAVGSSTSRNNSRLRQSMVLPVEPNQRHAYGHHQAGDVSLGLCLAAVNLQQLNLHQEHDATPTEGSPAVIDHQVPNADCSHLSFICSKSGISGPFTGAFVSRPLESNLEVASVVDTNMPSTDQQDTRIPKHHCDEQIVSSLDDSISPITSISIDNYDMLSTSQPDVIRNDTFDALHTIQRNFPSASGYAFSNITHNKPQQHIPMEKGIHICLSQVLTSTVVYASSPQPVTQSMPNTALFSDSVVTHHHALPSCSQPTLPIGYGGPNMVGRPFPPQNFAFLRSAATQQTHSGSNASQQSPAMQMLQCASTRYAIPRSSSGISADNIAPLADVASGYEGFGNPANIRRNYTGTLSTFPALTEVGLEENLGFRTQPPSPVSSFSSEGEDTSM